MSKFLKFLEPLHSWLYGYMVRAGLVLQATDTILTISMITNEALMVMENELTFTGRINRKYDDQFAIDGAKIGDTINVRRPARFTVSSGPTLQVQDFYESSVPVKVGDTNYYGDQAHVDTSFTTKDLRLSLGDFSTRVIRPAVSQIANSVDYTGLSMAKNWTAQTVGTAGTVPNDLYTFLSAGAVITSQAAPRDGNRSVVVDQFTEASIVNSLKGLFTPADKLGQQFRRGKMGTDSAGMDWYMDQNVNTQASGYWSSSASTLTVDTTSIGISTGWAQTSTLTLSHGASITLKKGDIIRIANVFPVNPLSRQKVGTVTQGFVVQSDVSGTGSSTMQVTVSPAVITGGQFQNVTIPTTSASATVTPVSIGTSGVSVNSPQNILFHRDAFTCVMVDLPMPGGVDMGARASSKQSNVALRVVRQYTINNDAMPARIDVLYGFAPLYPEWACRIAS